MQPVQQAPTGARERQTSRYGIGSAIFLRARSAGSGSSCWRSLSRPPCSWWRTSSTRRSPGSLPTTPRSLPKAPRTSTTSGRGSPTSRRRRALEKELTDQLGASSPATRGSTAGSAACSSAPTCPTQRKRGTRAKDYETLAARFPNSYLAPISLFDAAVCLEEKGDQTER